MSNVDTARAAYEAFGSGDLAALQKDFAENAVWVTSDELPLGGTVEGRDQIMANFAQIPN
jgi:ketosteroid isomerase-like protein